MKIRKGHSLLFPQHRRLSTVSRFVLQQTNKQTNKVLTVIGALAVGRQNTLQKKIGQNPEKEMMN